MSLLEIYTGSNELKKLLVKRSSEFDIPFRYACDEVGVEYSRFMSGYINALEVTKDIINEKQFEGILEIYGIDVRTLFIIKSDYNGEAMRLHLKSKYDRDQIERKVRKHGTEKST